MNNVPSKHKTFVCVTFVQCWTNVEDVGPTLYKSCTNVLRFLGITRMPSLIKKTYNKHYYCNNYITFTNCLNSLKGNVAARLRDN